MSFQADEPEVGSRPVRGRVFFRQIFAGIIEEREGRCIFTYDPSYLTNPAAEPISLTLPLRDEPYTERTMIPFFDGLIPEGWVLNIAVDHWKLDRRDRMGLLLTVCEDCIGAVSIFAEGRTPNWEKKMPERKKATQNAPSDNNSTGKRPRTARCLSCLEKLPSGNMSGGYHSRCSVRLFGTRIPPRVDFTLGDTQGLAAKNVFSRTTVTGVQPKLSLELDIDSATDRTSKRLTVVGFWGRFILKPPTAKYPEMPVLESTTMRMAELAGIRVADHGLIKLASGELAYVARRFDRRRETKLAVEDACQLSELLTEKKYKGSMEKVGKLIGLYSSYTGLDIIRFYEMAVFSFLTGNADMHLKNFSLLIQDDGRVTLSPAYDLLATKLLVPEGLEEMALTVNGKKAKLRRADFIALANTLSVGARATENALKRIATSIPTLLEAIDHSFLFDRTKEKYKRIIESSARTLELL